MLTDVQLEDLAGRMGCKLECVSFKDQLPKELKYNKGYIINMEAELDDKGQPNDGSHWVAFQIEKGTDGVIRPMYLDSFGLGPPTEVSEKVEKFCGKKLPYNSKDIQSIMSSCCGWYCLAWLHWINASQYRTGHIYSDSESFLDMFLDLNVSNEYKQNEYILKTFFRSADEAKRLPVDISEITKF
jgi:hypothetical protein